MLCRKPGYETRQEESVTGAVLALEEFGPDVTVLEAEPDGDGVVLARQLAEARLRTRVIFLTSRSAIEDKVAGLAVPDRAAGWVRAARIHKSLLVFLGKS